MDDILEFPEDDMFDGIEIEHTTEQTQKQVGLEANDLQQENGPSSPREGDNSRDDVLECLEEFVSSFLVKLANAIPSACSHPGSLSGTTKNKKIILQLADRTKGSPKDQCPMRSLVFPRMSKNPSARPFAQLFRVIDLIHEAIVDGVPVTKRDIFYKDVELFRSQATVDRLIDDLAATLQLTRAALNVRASSKGLMCGFGVTIHMQSGETLELCDRDACLIPHSEDIKRFAVTKTLAWVLIVEKEAAFQTLCRLRLATLKTLPGSGLIVTGKGYPDVATRQLVKTLSDNLPMHVPILALVDGDAYGIDILSVYKNGSTRMRHENAHLAADRVQWIGIWASELASLGIDKDALLPITKHDEKKARALLKRERLPARCRKELQHMLFIRRKAEIEVLGAARATQKNTADLDQPSSFPHYDYTLGKNPGIPILRYVVKKIGDACAESRHNSEG